MSIIENFNLFANGIGELISKSVEGEVLLWYLLQPRFKDKRHMDFLGSIEWIAYGVSQIVGVVKPDIGKYFSGKRKSGAIGKNSNKGKIRRRKCNLSHRLLELKEGRKIRGKCREKSIIGVISKGVKGLVKGINKIKISSSVTVGKTIPNHELPYIIGGNSFSREKEVSFEWPKDFWTSKNIPVETVLKYVPGIKDGIGESSLGKAVYTRKNFSDYFKKVTQGMNNKEVINFANKRLGNYKATYEALRKDYGYAEGVKRWDELIESKEVRYELEALKKLANKATAREHYLLFDDLKRDLSKIDAKFKIKVDPLNLLYLLEEELLALKMEVCNDYEKYTTVIKKEIDVAIKEAFIRVEYERDALVQVMNCEREVVLGRLKNLYEKNL